MITPDFAAYAVKADLHFSSPLPAKDIRPRIEALLTRIAAETMGAGAYLIGHIKCIVETPGQGFLASSVTDPKAGPMTKDHLDGPVPEMDVIINVLLYGLSREKVQEIVDPLARHELSFAGADVDLEDLEKEHDHEHGDHEHEHGHEHDHDHHEHHHHEHC